MISATESVVQFFIRLSCAFIGPIYGLVVVSLRAVQTGYTFLPAFQLTAIKKRKTMKSQQTITALLTVLILTASSLTAQQNDSRFGFELNIGPAYATTQLVDADLGAGLGFEGVFHYRILKHTGVYLGWGWKHFGSGESFAGSDMDFEETGYIYGIQFKHPLTDRGLSYVIRAGGTYNHVELENRDGEIISDTGHGPGWQLSAGIELPIGRSWTLIPTVKYNALNRDYESGEGNYNSSLNTLSAQIGFFKNF